MSGAAEIEGLLTLVLGGRLDAQARELVAAVAGEFASRFPGDRLVAHLGRALVDTVTARVTDGVRRRSSAGWGSTPSPTPRWAAAAAASSSPAGPRRRCSSSSEPSPEAR